MNNPYVQHLIESGYDENDCRIATDGVCDSYPRVIHGRVFETEMDYNEAVHEFLNGL